MRQLYCCIIIFLLSATTSLAQEGKNPFELQGRSQATTEQKATPRENVTDNPLELQGATKEAATDTNTLQTSPTPAKPDAAVPHRTGNPFELRGDAPTTQQKKSTNTTVTRKQSSNKASVSADNNFIFGINAFMLILLTLLITLYRSLVQKIYRAFLNDNFLAMIHREEGGIVSIPYLLLYFLFFISGGTFLFLLLRYYGQLDDQLFKSWGQCIGVLSGVFFVKHLCLKIMANVFPVAKEIKQYSFMIIIFSIILGIILVPINIMLAYLPAQAVQWVIYLAFTLVLLIYLFRALRGIFLSSKYITFYKFHFFMYLCTVEIAPVLILVKFGLILAGIQ